MDRSAIVLAGGFSSRFGQDKGILELDGKPLIKHVVDAIGRLVNEIIIVTSSQERVTQYVKITTANVQFAIDVCESNSPLIGALTGFECAHGQYSLLLPIDSPFISKEVVSLLFELCLNKTATIPRWPNCQIEPLHAVYHTKLALEAAKTAVAEGKFNVRAMIDKLQGVRYVSTLAIQQLDPELLSFFNINTPLDLEKARTMVKHRKRG